MTIRQLTVTESAQVSGAASGCSDFGNNFDNAIRSFQKIAELYSPAYGGKDWHYIVAMEPELNRAVSGYFDSLGIGLDGKGSVAAWKQLYA